MDRREILAISTPWEQFQLENLSQATQSFVSRGERVYPDSWPTSQVLIRLPLSFAGR